MTGTDNNLIRVLSDKGVDIPDPASVFVAPDVPADAVEPGAVLMPGTRLSGSSLVIGAGSIIGAEGPVTVKDCQIGRKVSLGSGFFDGSVFLDGSSMGGGAHVRPGCLLEEQASGAHAVGLKQTILLPYVTLGSLINFCDCLMAGGTSRKNHSEVGSSYIHFNFTPHQDKATASLIGDVPRGVLLDQPPIFLGGQGGLVGPCRIAFGTVVPAGQIVRRDIETPGLLVVPKTPEPGTRAYDPAIYGSIDRMVGNSLAYIGNIIALSQWYRCVRLPLAGGDPVARACGLGGLQVLESVLKERVKRLGELADKLAVSADRLDALGAKGDRELAVRQRAFARAWPRIKEGLAALSAADAGVPACEPLQKKLAAGLTEASYTEWIGQLDPDTKAAATAWLSRTVDAVIALRNHEKEDT